MRLLPLLLASLLLAPAPILARVPAASAVSQEDGPYVTWSGTQATVGYLRDGRWEEHPLPASRRLDLPGLPALRLDPAPPAPAPADFPLPAQVAAVSDAHGHLDSLRALLAAQGIIDRQGRWRFGKGHLVVVGDLVDRGGQVTGIYWLLRSLEAQAQAAGGRVHVLLGNHEVMDLAGDLRYLNPRYRALPRPYPAMLGPDTDFGRWLRARPVMLRLGDLLFVHGGPSPAFAAAHPDLAAVNAAARQELRDRPGPVLGPGGPLWYRGLVPGADRSDARDAEVTAILAAYRVRTLVIGHTTLDRLTLFHDGRVVAIDAGLKDDQPGELWLQLQGRRYRGLADGSRQAL